MVSCIHCFNFLAMRPGFAFGGSCLPKDVRALQELARKKDVSSPLLHAILQANEDQIARAEALMQDWLRQHAPATVAAHDKAAWAALRGAIAPLRVRIAGKSCKGRRGSPCAAPPSASLKAASTSAVPTCSPRSNRFQSANKAASAISVRAAPPEMAMRLPREATRTPSTCSIRAR